MHLCPSYLESYQSSKYWKAEFGAGDRGFSAFDQKMWQNLGNGVRSNLLPARIGWSEGPGHAVP